MAKLTTQQRKAVQIDRRLKKLERRRSAEARDARAPGGALGTLFDVLGDPAPRPARQARRKQLEPNELQIVATALRAAAGKIPRAGRGIALGQQQGTTASAPRIGRRRYAQSFS